MLLLFSFQMNVTRMLWNDKLKCKKEGRKMDVIYLACSCVVAAMPVLFYLSAGLFTTVIRNRLQMREFSDPYLLF